MHDDASAPQDALTDVLLGLRVEAVRYRRFRVSAPWHIPFPAQPSVQFLIFAGQRCEIHLPDTSHFVLGDGDAVLFPRGIAHVVSSWPYDRATAKPSDLKRLEDAAVGESRTSTISSGSLYFGVGSAHPLLRMMPNVMRVSAMARHDPLIALVVGRMAQEALGHGTGSGGMLARLADVFVASFIRLWIAQSGGDVKGWLAAIQSPDIGHVLGAIQRDPNKDWSVSALAKLAGASRSRFTQRFATIVGETPARYVAKMRMYQAYELLARDKLKVGVVARHFGYDSDASFSRAFKRIIGDSPAKVRAQGAVSESHRVSK